MGINESYLVTLTTETKSKKLKSELPWAVLILKIELWEQHNVLKGADQQNNIVNLFQTYFWSTSQT